MSDLQPEGYSYAKSDVRRENVEAAYDSAARQSFSLKVSNLFFSDIMEAASRQPASVFEDEIRAYTAAPSIASEIQEDGINKVDATKVFRDEYEFYAKPLKVEKVRGMHSARNYQMRPKFKVTGYIISRLK